MALAETDLNLRRADLGLIGAVLQPASIGKSPVAASARTQIEGLFTAVPTPVAPASPAVEAVPAVSSQR